MEISAIELQICALQLEISSIQRINVKTARHIKTLYIFCLETVAKCVSNPSSLDCESGILPLSYRAQHNTMLLSMCTVPRVASATRCLTVCTDLSVDVPSRERCVQPPQHHRVMSRLSSNIAAWGTLAPRRQYSRTHSALPMYHILSTSNGGLF